MDFWNPFKLKIPDISEAKINVFLLLSILLFAKPQYRGFSPNLSLAKISSFSLLSQRAKANIPELENLTFVNGNSMDVYKSMGDDVSDCEEIDVIYLDPMYPIFKKNTKKSGKIESIKKILELENFKDENDNFIKKFFDVDYRKIILKRPLKHRKNYSNINYQVFGKTTRFDIYL